MIVRSGRNGSQFLGCSGYPDCKTIMSLNALTEADEEQEEKPQEVCEEKCEKCGSDMVFKIGPYGKYMQCTNETCKNRKNAPADRRSAGGVLAWDRGGRLLLRQAAQPQQNRHQDHKQDKVFHWYDPPYRSKIQQMWDLREDADLTQEQLVKYRGCTKLPTPTANRASASRLLS